MHLGWGVGTMVGMARFGLPFPAFANLVREAPAPEAGGLGADGVYAPSLHREDA
jgi:hypothetical protein